MEFSLLNGLKLLDYGQWVSCLDTILMKPLKYFFPQIYVFRMNSLESERVAAWGLFSSCLGPNKTVVVGIAPENRGQEIHYYHTDLIYSFGTKF